LDSRLQFIMVTRVVSVEMAPRCTNTAFFADILGTVSCISKLDIGSGINNHLA